MDHIVKLFKKISKKDREALKSLVLLLQETNPASAQNLPAGLPPDRDGRQGYGVTKKKLNVKKLQNSDFYRARKGRFRIIFHLEKKNVVIDSIKMRNEK